MRHQDSSSCGVYNFQRRTKDILRLFLQKRLQALVHHTFEAFAITSCTYVNTGCKITLNFSTLTFGAWLRLVTRGHENDEDIADQEILVESVFSNHKYRNLSSTTAAHN